MKLFSTQKKINVFLSHSWRYSISFEHVKSLLNDSEYDFTNNSIEYDGYICTEGNSLKLEYILAEKITSSDIVIFAEIDTGELAARAHDKNESIIESETKRFFKSSKWRSLELSLAAQYGKPILGVGTSSTGVGPETKFNTPYPRISINNHDIVEHITELVQESEYKYQQHFIEMNGAWIIIKYPEDVYFKFKYKLPFVYQKHPILLKVWMMKKDLLLEHDNYDKVYKAVEQIEQLFTKLNKKHQSIPVSIDEWPEKVIWTHYIDSSPKTVEQYSNELSELKFCEHLRIKAEVDPNWDFYHEGQEALNRAFKQ
jgi:hypothetical protein